MVYSSVPSVFQINELFQKAAFQILGPRFPPKQLHLPFSALRSAGQLCHYAFSGQEYKRKQLEEQRQAERLQRQLQQERDYLVSLQQQQQQQRQDQRPAEKKPLYHYKEGINASEKPAWAKEVGESEENDAFA